MSTIRCPQCNLVNWDTATECKRCRSILQASGAAAVETAAVGGFQTTPNTFSAPPSVPQTGYQQSAYPPSSYRQPPPTNNYPPPNSYAPPNNHQTNYRPNYQAAQHSPVKLKNGLAIAGMVCGIIAVVSFIVLIGMAIAPIAFIISIVALVKAVKRPHEYGGKGFAVAGLVTSALILLLTPIILSIAIPNIMAARRAANEGSAISTIRSIAKAGPGLAVYPSGYVCYTLPDMVKQGTVNPNLADGENNGYRFAITQAGNGCVVTATPISTSDGGRSFWYSNTENRLHGANKGGAPADSSDPVIN